MNKRRSKVVVTWQSHKLHTLVRIQPPLPMEKHGPFGQPLGPFKIDGWSRLKGGNSVNKWSPATRARGVVVTHLAVAQESQFKSDGPGQCVCSVSGSTSGFQPEGRSSSLRGRLWAGSLMGERLACTQEMGVRFSPGPPRVDGVVVARRSPKPKARVQFLVGSPRAGSLMEKRLAVNQRDGSSNLSLFATKSVYNAGCDAVLFAHMEVMRISL